MLRKRFPLDIALSASIALLSQLPALARFESGRILLLAIVYAAIAVLAKTRTLSERSRLLLDLAVSAVFFASAWLQSFPAHPGSGAIGVDIVCGVAVLVVALTFRAQPKRVDAAPAIQSLLAIWNLR